jgi:capsular polysaccharide biosynthesis protein
MGNPRLDRPRRSTTSGARGRAQPLAAPAPTANPYIALALRWWWVLAVGAGLGLVGSLAFLRFGPISYQSTVQVMVPPPVDPSEDTLGSPRTVRDAATNFAAQAGTMRVFSLASAALQGKMSVSAADLMRMQQDKQLVITPEKGANFVDITAQDRDPERVRLLATTLADEFVKEVNDRAAESVATRKKQLEAQIELARDQLTTAQLHQRESDLLKELRDQRAQLLLIQTNYQQELQRQATLERLPVAESAASTERAPPQLTEAAARVASQSLGVLAAQQKEQEATVATLNGQLDAVRAALQRGPTAELRQREQELSTALQTQRAQLLQSNQAYQQELQRLAATDQGRLSPAQERQRQELAAASAQVRNDWLRVVGEQQKDAAANIATIEQQLTDVRDALATRPGTNDAAVSAAFAQAYSNQLLALTQVYTRLQMNSQTTTNPLTRYGEASPAIPIVTAKKVLPVGVGGGVALGAATALVLHLLERRRKAAASAEAPADVGSPADADAPASAPVEPRATPATPTRPHRTSAADLRRLQKLYRDSRQSDRPRSTPPRRWPVS